MPDRLPDLEPGVQSALRELMQDDYGLLLETFRLDAEKRLARLRASLGDADWETFRQSAHSLKGSCGNMGALALQQACHQAEQAGMDADAEAAQRAFAELDRLYLRLEPHLSE